MILAMNLMENVDASTRRERAGLDRASLGSAIHLVLKSNVQCAAGIRDAAAVGTFGRLRTEIENEVLSIINSTPYTPRTDIMLNYPGPDAVNLIGPGVRYNSIQVTDFTVDTVTPIAVNATRRAYLVLTRANLATVGIRPLMVPIYVVTDLTGVMTSCNVTNFTSEPRPDGTPNTVDDFLCVGFTGDPNSRYNPLTKACI